jgi:hypothetical protein
MKRIQIYLIIPAVLLAALSAQISMNADNKVMKNQNPFALIQNALKAKVNEVTGKLKEGLTGSQAVARQKAATGRKETSLRITNTSDVPTSFIIMVLHSTDEQTPIYYPPLKCYIGQTVVSDPLALQAHQADILSLNELGKEVIDSDRIFGAFVVAIQVRTEADPDAGQSHQADVIARAKSGVPLVSRDKNGKITLVKVLSEKEYLDAAKHTVRLIDSNKSYFSKFTKTWISNAKKKKLLLKPSNANNFSYPADFVFDKEVREDFTRPNYDEVIRQLKAAENKIGDKVFPASYFNKTTLEQLPDATLYDALSTAMNINSKPIVWKTALLGDLLDTGKYKYIANILVQFFLGVVVTILSGGGAASLISDIAQQAANSGSDLGAEISDLHARS